MAEGGETVSPCPPLLLLQLEAWSLRGERAWLWALPLLVAETMGAEIWVFCELWWWGL